MPEPHLPEQHNRDHRSTDEHTPAGLGTLSWQPVTERGDLISEPVAAALANDMDQEQVFVTEIDPDLADTAAFCQTYASPPESSANCVVVAGRRGETSLSAALLVLATARADVNRTVRKHLGLRKISFATMDDAVADTGMAYGGIGPIGLPADWQLLIDAAVLSRPWIVIGSGFRHSKLAIPGVLAGQLPGAEVLELTLA